MGETRNEAYKYSTAVVIVFGILGNILVIISILRQKNLLKSNYYYLVLHLAICDLGALIIYLLHHINWNFLKEPLFVVTFYCLFHAVCYTLAAAGACTMLVISVLRYRATVHPLKTCHQSTEIESRLWFSVRCWFDCWLWTSYA